MNDSSESETLLARAKSGDSDALGELMLTHRDRLVRVVRFRLDRLLNGRIDPGDVVQDEQIHTRQHRMMKKLRARMSLYTGGPIGSSSL